MICVCKAIWQPVGYNRRSINEKEENVRRDAWTNTTAVALAISILVSACSAAPIDADVIKAVSQSDFFTGGYGNTLQEPVVVLERRKRNTDGTWPIKVKMKFTFRKSDGKETIMESSPLFRIRKVKDAAGKDEWKAELSS
jgi:hypothetical protein